MNPSGADVVAQVVAEPPERGPGNWNDRFALQIYRRADGDFGWRARSSHNGEIVAAGEGYRNRGDMLKLLEALFPQADHSLEERRR